MHFPEENEKRRWCPPCRCTRSLTGARHPALTADKGECQHRSEKHRPHAGAPGWCSQPRPLRRTPGPPASCAPPAQGTCLVRFPFDPVQVASARDTSSELPPTCSQRSGSAVARDRTLRPRHDHTPDPVATRAETLGESGPGTASGCGRSPAGSSRPSLGCSPAKRWP